VRRNDLDICADILQVARVGAKKTHLVYKANLNFEIVKKYLSRLSENRLISSENGHYITTEEGVKFLDNYQKFTSMYSRDGL
jgi:predicted transcriptional regulator